MKISLEVGKMIAKDIQPISIVDDFGFRQLLNVIEPRYKLPSLRFITEKILEKLNNDVRSNIKVQLIAKSISFLIDMWTSRYKPDSNMSLTSHWIDGEFKQCLAVLFCEKFDGSHSSDNIRAAFDNMVTNWETLPNAYHIIVHDNASNVKKAFKQPDIGQLFCTAHTIQLCIKDAIENNILVEPILAVIRGIVGHFKSSSSANGRLKELQISHNLPLLQPIQDVKTR
jgi:hypothetical protein